MNAITSSPNHGKFKAHLKALTVTVTGEDADQLIEMGYGSMSVQGDENCLFLTLLDEEAMYLFITDQASIYDSASNSLMNDSLLWATFSLKNSNFPMMFTVYNDLRKRGFIVKTAINFGMDYCAYRSHPKECHSEFCVRVFNSMSAERISWRSISTMTRVMPDVMKLCLLYYVNFSGASTNSVVGLEQTKLASIRTILVNIRRSPISTEKYLKVSQLQAKYQYLSKLKASRKKKADAFVNLESVVRTKLRRDVNEIRLKSISKSNTHWLNLLQEETSP